MQIVTQVTITSSCEDIAKRFAHANSDEQAIFLVELFEQIGKVMSEYRWGVQAIDINRKLKEIGHNDKEKVIVGLETLLTHLKGE